MKTRQHGATLLVTGLVLIMLGGLLASCTSDTGAAPNPATTKISDAPAAANAAAPAPPQPTGNRFAATVVRVVDGDTLEVTFAGRKETIRMLLIDTPETVHPDKPVQPFGPEASALVKGLMPAGSTIEVEKDVSERDKYGRYLAYVYVGGKSVQELLLEKGLARVAYVYAPNVKYVDRYRAIQAKAQAAGVGIWSVENYVTAEGFSAGAKGTGSGATAPAPPPPPTAYDPNGPDRDCSDFTTQAEAQAFYEAAGGPAKDPHKLDGSDRDGRVCETLP